jgi:hypothetical protein
MAEDWLPRHLFGESEAHSLPAAANPAAVAAAAFAADTQLDPSPERERVPRRRPHEAPRSGVDATPPPKRPAGVAGEPGSPLQPLSERLTSVSARGSLSPTAAAYPSGGMPSDQPVINPAAAQPALARNCPNFVRIWNAWVDKHWQKSGEYLEPDLTERLLNRSLFDAQKVLANISKPDVEKPVGLLIWHLRKLEGEPGAPTRSLERQSSAVSSADSRPPVVERPGRHASAQPPADPLQTQLPLAVIDRGEAGNLAAEMLYCPSCALQQSYRRRAVRASGLEQPLSLHRFMRCNCGCLASLQMFEHFPSVHLLTFMMVRAAATMSDQPSLVPAQSTRNNPDGSLPAADPQAPVPVRRYPCSDIRCPACRQTLSVTVYDPIDHLFHSVELGCPSCQDIYGGVLMHHSERLFGTLLRSRLTG